MIALVAAALLALALGAAALDYALMRRPLPRISGDVELDGLTAPVRIMRDRRGVPHIEAEGMDDAAFACGFVHAQDRGWQLELLRRVATGRVAEIAGPEGIGVDRLVRRLGLMRFAAAEERELTGEAKTMLECYAAGVNAVLCTGAQPRPLELRMLRVRPEPWRPAHTLAIGRLFALGDAVDCELELIRLRVLQAGGPELAAALDLVDPPLDRLLLREQAARVPMEAIDATRDLFAGAARWLPAGGAPASGNCWVVAARMAAGGHPMLCTDVHESGTVPSPWYQLHVSAGSDFESAGASRVGLPFVVQGHNRRAAWGFTNAMTDVQDIVIEEIDGSGHRYRTEAGWEDCAVLDEVIAVRGGDEVSEELVLTRHGPVLETFDDPGGRGRRALALHWPALLPSAGDIGGLLDLQRAANFAEFRSALRFQATAPQNAIYADVDGHTGYALGGRLPVRPQPASRLPQAGWEADRRPTAWVPLDEMPHVLDPDDHLIVAANNRLVGGLYPHHVAFDHMTGYRALRVDQLLRGRIGVDRERMAAIQQDVVCGPARVVAELLATIRCEDRLAEEARCGVVEWDGVMDPVAAEPTVYAAFVRELGRLVLEPHVGEDWMLMMGASPHPLGTPVANPTGRIIPVLLRRWQSDDTGLLLGRSWYEVATQALEEAVAGLQGALGHPRRWAWGAVHAVPLEHALSTRRRFRMLFNRRRIEVGGDPDTVQAVVPLAGGVRAGHLPALRMIQVVGSWSDCTAIILPGQSGHLGSHHYSDLIGDWKHNRQHAIGWGPAEPEDGVEGVLTLNPPLAHHQAGDATRWKAA